MTEDDKDRLAALHELALRLDGDGRRKDALALLEIIAGKGMVSSDILRTMVGWQDEAGRTVDAVETLVKLCDGTTADRSGVVELVKTYAPKAVEDFNRHLADGKIAEAERCAAALAVLVPQSDAFLVAARDCNAKLGRTDKVAYYTAALTARSRTPAQAAALEDEEAIAAALSPKPGTHPLIHLRDLCTAVGAALCRPLTVAANAKLVETLLSAAKALPDIPGLSPELAQWERHFRSIMDAVDLDAVFGPTPSPDDNQSVSFVTSNGAAADWQSVRAAAERLGAKAVFFVAADRDYVDRFAGWYAGSVLRNCDVPCLVVVHVIGGANELSDIAASLKLDDERLYFSGDAFDVKAVATLCCAEPPNAYAKPVAHLQSMRFILLGGFLRELKVPVFVSDIDLVLRYGVADLLARGADFDLMLNENTGNVQIGSRLTANLMLVNDTPNALVFVDFLSRYLERELAKPAVTRWIDQAGLVIARHHLMLHGDCPRIGYLDTDKDINNLMFPAYMNNPFRFFSFFQNGFDMASLKSIADISADSSPDRKVA
jgi:hypothetical protein